MSDRTITYDRFLSRVAPLTGVQSSDLTVDDKASIREFFTRAIRTIWEAAPWPDICVLEARTPSSNIIAYEQSGETEIESVFAIYDVDPHGTTAFDLQNFDIVPSGVKLVGNDATTDAVYVWYRKRVPDFFGDAYSATTTYAVGDQVYYATTGDYYKCTAESTGNVPSNTSFWERLTIPFRFVDYCVSSVYADWLRQDGQHGKGAYQDRFTQEALEKELDRLERQEGYVTARVTQTHLSNYDNT